MLNYFAYGSNMHPLRLRERLAHVELVGTAQATQYQLRFNKKGQDGSAKCNIAYTGQASAMVFGAVYRLSSQQQQRLHDYEGKGAGYYVKQLDVATGYGMLDCFTYCADPLYIDDNLLPFAWYKSLVLLGAHYWQFPAEYIQAIATVATSNDGDKRRSHSNKKLIEKIERYQQQTRTTSPP